MYPLHIRHIVVVIIWLIGTVKSDDYIRRMIPIEQVNDDINYIQQSKTSVPGAEYIKDQRCDNTGCDVEFTKEFNIILTKGFGTNFILSQLGLMNQTIEVGVVSSMYSITLEYMYSMPLAKTYARWTSDNYHPFEYSECKKGVGVGDFISADNLALPDDYVKVISKSYLRDYGAMSANAYTCGHYWLTTFHLCAEKGLFYEPNRFLIAYRLTDEVSLESELYVKIGTTIKKQKYTGKSNERETIEFDDNIKLEIEPLGTIINPKGGVIIICDGVKSSDSKSVDCSNWYVTKNVPEKGVIPTVGFGMYQLVNLNNPTKLLYNKLQLDWDGGIFSCSDVKSFSSKFYIAKPNNVQNPDPELSFLESAFKRQPGSQTDMFRIMTSASNYTYELKSSNDGSCCIHYTSSSDDLLDSCKANFRPITAEFMDINANFKQTIKLVDGGVPEPFNLETRLLTRTTSTSRLVTKGLRLQYDTNEPSVDNVKITEMNYYENAAGSNFKFEMTYSGPSGTLTIKSTDINLLQEEYYVQTSGTIRDTIGFKSKGIMLVSPTICFGHNSRCVKPDKINKLTPSDGSVDDPTSSSSTGYVDKAYDFLSIVFSNLWFGLLFILLMLLNVLGTIFFLMVFYKTIKRTFVLGLLLCCTGRSNAFNYDETAYSKVSLTIGPVDKIAMKLNPVTIWEPSVLYELIKDSDISIIAESKSKKYDDQIPTHNGVQTISSTNISINGVFKQTNNQIVLYNLCLPNIIRFDMEAYGFVLTGPVGFKLLTKLDDVKQNVIDGKYNYASQYYHGNETYYILALSDVDVSKGTYDGDVYYFLIPNTRNSGRLTYLEHTYMGPSNNGLLLKLAGFVKMFDENVIQYIKNNFDIKGEYALSVLMNKNSDISKMIVFLQCIDKCTIELHKDSRLKNKISFHKKMIRSIKSKEEWHATKLAVKEKLYSLKGNDFKIGDSFNRWSTNDNSRYMYISNYHLTKLAESNKETISDLKNVDDVKMSEINMIEQRGYNGKQSFELMKHGPIKLNCEMYTDYSYCYNMNSQIHVFVKNFMVTTTINSVTNTTIDNKIYKINVRHGTISVTPNTRHCDGELFIDSKSKLYCSYDCCLLSDDDWQSFKVIDASQQFLIGNHGQKDIMVKKYSTQGEHLYAVKGTQGCITTSFNECWSCAWDQHAILMWLLCYWPLLVVIFAILILLLRLLFSIIVNTRYSRVYSPLKNMLDNTTNAVTGSEYIKRQSTNRRKFVGFNKL